MSADIGSFSGQADFESHLRRALIDKKYVIRVAKEGGFRTVPSLSDFIAQANEFVESVDPDATAASVSSGETSVSPTSESSSGKKRKSAVLFDFTVQDYGVAKNWPPRKVPPSTAAATSALTKLRIDGERALTLQNELVLIQMNPDLYRPISPEDLQSIGTSIDNAIQQIDNKAREIIAQPLGKWQVKDYIGVLKLPDLKLPTVLPVKVTVYNARRVTLEIGLKGELTGNVIPLPYQGDLRYLDRFGVAFATRIPGVSIHYKAVFYYVHDWVQRENYTAEGKDGQEIGAPRPTGYDFALRSVYFWLTGAHASEYKVVYSGQRKHNGELRACNKTSTPGRLGPLIAASRTLPWLASG